MSMQTKYKSLENYIETAEMINRSVESGKPDADAQEISNLMKPMGNEQTLYRGLYGITIDELEGLDTEGADIGSVFHMKGFTSFSRNPITAREFTDEDGIMLEVLTSPSTLGMTLANKDTKQLPDQFEQYETILQYGQKARIYDISEWDGMGYVRLMIE